MVFDWKWIYETWILLSILDIYVKYTLGDNNSLVHSVIALPPLFDPDSSKALFFIWTDQ